MTIKSCLLPQLVLGMSLGLALTACDDSSGGSLGVIDEPPDAGCARPHEPSSYEVYFVLDVSGSMNPFLKDLRNELLSFATGFPDTDSGGRRVRIDYYLIAFVNDVKNYGGGRMTSIIALQDAFDQAIAAGQTGYNLNVHTFNGEPQENTLDALSAVFDLHPSAEAKLIILATDADLVEAPTVLTENIQVKSNYHTLFDQLSMLGMRVHAFTISGLDGLTRDYKHMPALTTLPGSTVHSFQQLQGANEQIRATLTSIAQGSACN